MYLHTCICICTYLSYAGVHESWLSSFSWCQDSAVLTVPWWQTMVYWRRGHKLHSSIRFYNVLHFSYPIFLPYTSLYMAYIPLPSPVHLSRLPTSPSSTTHLQCLFPPPFSSLSSRPPPFWFLFIRLHFLTFPFMSYLINTAYLNLPYWTNTLT